MKAGSSPALVKLWHSSMGWWQDYLTDAVGIETIYTHSECHKITTTGHTVPSPEHQNALTKIIKTISFLWYACIFWLLGFFHPIRSYLNLIFFTKHDHFKKRQWPNPLSCVPVTSRSSQVVTQELLHCATIWQQTGKSLLCQLSPVLGLTAGKCNSQKKFRISLSMTAFPK